MVRRNKVKSARRLQRQKEANLEAHYQKIRQVDEKKKSILEEKQLRVRRDLLTRSQAFIDTNINQVEKNDKIKKRSISKKHSEISKKVKNSKQEKSRETLVKKAEAAQRFENFELRRKQLEKLEKARVRELKQKQKIGKRIKFSQNLCSCITFIENMKTQRFLEKKEIAKNQKLNDIINSEIEIEALNELYHSKIWNNQVDQDDGKIKQNSSSTSQSRALAPKFRHEPHKESDKTIDKDNCLNIIPDPESCEKKSVIDRLVKSPKPRAQTSTSASKPHKKS